MDLRSLFRESFLSSLLVLSVLLVLITGCSDSDEVYTDPSADDSSGLISQSNGRVQMTTSECGTAPTTNVVFSKDIDAPTIMTTGQIVSGRVYPNSTNGQENFWDITLAAGYYHVVLESENVNGVHTQLGLNLADLNINDATDDAQIISGSATDLRAFRSRFYGFIELEEARNVILRVTGEYQTEDYKLAVFESESAVPVPLLTDCPTVNELSLDSAESFFLPGKSSWAEDRWYRVELDTKAYLLKTRTAISSGVSGGIDYSVLYVNQFGGLQTVQSVNQTGTDTDGIGRIKLSEPGTIWIRIENNNINELTMELTLTPEI